MLHKNKKEIISDSLSCFLGWRDVEEVQPRCHGKLKILEELFAQVKQLRPADAPEIKGTIKSPCTCQWKM